jgi:hypothetical protein
MKAIVDWIKANPLILGSAIVALLSLAWLGLTITGGTAFVAKVVERGKLKSKLAGYRTTPVQLPPEKPDMPARTVNIPVNEAAYNDLNEIYQKIGVHNGQISGIVLQRNEANHIPLDTKLFPDVDDSMQHKLYEAKRKYQRAFKDMLLAPTGEETPGQVRLAAGSPPASSDLMLKLDKLREAALRSRGIFNPKDVTNLNDDDIKTIHREQKEGLINTLKQAAATVQIFAGTDIATDSFSFHVDPWSNETETLRPEIIQIWDSQIGLWIQQDIARAIMHTNQPQKNPATDAAADGGDAPVSPKPSVLTNPIKQLISINVSSGYVGINFEGAVTGTAAGARRAAGANKTILGLIIPSKPLSLGDPNQKLTDVFTITPSGRRSNPLYDVRHAELRMIVDVLQLPRFFNELNNVNFMTVLSMSVTDVDEYTALRQGYYYGSSDVAEVSITLETIWFRQWTKKYMPAKVKQHLDIKEPAPAASAAIGG